METLLAKSNDGKKVDAQVATFFAASFARLLFLSCALAAPGSAGNLDDARCSACAAIIDELASSVAREPPRMNVDLRLMTERLANKGDGKITPFELSELRALERLESMCPPMKNYVMVEESGRSYFQRAFGIGEGEGMVFGGSITLNTDQSRDQGRSLRTYCDRIVEEFEDDITHALRQGMDRLDERICVDILHTCNSAEELNSLPRVAKRVEQMALNPVEEARPEDIERAARRSKKRKRRKRKATSEKDPTEL